ncbi:uncharacterized abhydrolase domain-containing protein DDB_G0269086-like [Brassica napus]|uniref:uncharacterized abhydrolase domain-containing protein DDB_G0269086-like n=1 Tax=Brassica napus TaxID=3708 RepID=UPI00207899B1|nr:uncharacterized abhydrolase domain-containing protein DDB_G0269086-like [Brassica napus]
MAAEMDISMSVRVFEELTSTKAEPNGIFSVKMRASYNVFTGHPNKTQDWQRAYFYVKSDEHAFEEPPGDDYRVLWNKELGRDLLVFRHPNTIAYPEKFFESAQAIAAHSHLRWPDLSREWIRRQQARIARVDWESRLLCVVGPRKSRLSLFTRKQQKLLNKAREMEGVPDLSALLKGRLQLLSKKSAPVDRSESTDSGDVGASKEGASNSNDEGVRVEPSAPSPKKKKKDKKTTEKSADETSPLLSASLATSSEGQGTKKKKKKRARNEATSRDEGTAMDDAIPVERPKKKTKKKAAETEPEKKRKALVQRSGSGSESAGGEKSVPGSSTSRGPRLEGSLPKKGRIEYPDRGEFLYDEKTPLILNPLRCAELTRQIRGGTKELPQLEDLFFRDEYIDAAALRAQSDGSMNFLVERYDTTLKQTMAQLGAADKLAATRLKVIERVRAELKQGSEKAAKEKEVLRIKFEELESKLKADRAAKKELVREKVHLEGIAAGLEKEKVELLAERDAEVDKLDRERQRLKDSRGLEVTRERERVEAAMIEKASRSFTRVRDHFARLDALGKAKNLYGQASGTKRCLEMIKESGTEIPQDMIDMFAEQEKLYEAEVTKLRVSPLADRDFSLSPLVLPSRFVEERFRRTFDPYGSNVDLIRPETASQLITSREVTEEPPEEPLGDVTSAPTEQAVVPEESAHKESPEKEDLEEIPEKSSPITDEGIEKMGVEDPVVVSDSSSGDQGEEGDGDAGEMSRPRPSEEGKTDDVVEGDAASSPPGVEPLASTRPEENVTPIAEKTRPNFLLLDR